MYGALAMAACHFVVGGILSAGEYVPEGVGGDKNVLIRVSGGKAHSVIAFSYLLIIVYALTLAPVAWVYAAEVWSLETRASGMVRSVVSQLLDIRLILLLGYRRYRKLDIQFCIGSICPAWIPRHQV